MVSPISYGPCVSQTSFTRMEPLLAVDQLKTMLRTERKYRVPRLLCHDDSDKNNSQHGEWRKKICQWSFKVIDHFKIDREVVSGAMNILDRYLAKEANCLGRDDMIICEDQACLQIIDCRTFQLTAMTSLYLSIKLSDNNEGQYSSSRNLRLDSFVELSRGQFCADEITKMERTILYVLQWEVFPPTPMTAVSYLLFLMPSHDNLPYTCHQSYTLVLHVLHELARYLTELSVCHGSICTVHTSSQIAYASILLSMELITQVALPMHVRDNFNETVSSASLLSGGTVLSSQDDQIKYLKEVLRESFWPEMLVDDCEYAEISHPISMAKDFGLLDTSHMVSPHHVLDINRTSLSHWGPSSAPFKEAALEDSPISCVNRHF